jgi:hypothetical protein
MAWTNQLMSSTTQGRMAAVQMAVITPFQAAAPSAGALKSFAVCKFERTKKMLTKMDTATA